MLFEDDGKLFFQHQCWSSRHFDTSPIIYTDETCHTISGCYFSGPASANSLIGIGRAVSMQCWVICKYEHHVLQGGPVMYSLPPFWEYRWVLTFMWLKFTVMWRFFRLAALAAGLDAPENIRRCFANNYDVEVRQRHLAHPPRNMGLFPATM